MKIYKGELHIGKPSKGSGEEWVEIQLDDDTSNLRAVTIRVSLEAFARATVGNGTVECEYEWNDSGLVGKVREHKTEIVARPTSLLADEAARQIAEAFAPYEVDGWRGRKRDATNHHNWRGNGQVEVVFVRYVERLAEAKAQEAQ